MKMKKLLGLLVVLGMAIFAFTACSSDDDDNEQTGTYEYNVAYSSFQGSLNNMNDISKAFATAFGVSDTPIKLTGTKSECDRKAKEYAIKAESALANYGKVDAKIEFTNMTTGDVIYKFELKKDDNGVFEKNGFWYVTETDGVIFKNLNGKRMKILCIRSGKTVFDGTIESDSQKINLNKSEGTFYHVVMEGGTSFNFRLP